jgi:hypothetical protein
MMTSSFVLLVGEYRPLGLVLAKPSGGKACGQKMELWVYLDQAGRV